MKDWAIQKAISWFWITVVTAVVAVALYVSLGRYVAGVLPQMKHEILDLVSDQTDFMIDVDTISGSWEAFAPSVVLDGIYLLSFDRSETLLEVGRAELGLDLWASLRDLALRFRLAHVTGIELELRENARGSWNLVGLAGGEGDQKNLDRLIDALLAVKRLELQEVTVVVHPLVAEERRLNLGVELERDKEFRRAILGVSNSDTDTTVSVLIETDGNPRDLETLASSAWIDFKTRDAGLITPFLGPGSPLPDYGQLSGRIWVDWYHGRGAFVTELEGSELAVDWPGARRESTPLQEISLLASGEYGSGQSRFMLHGGTARWQHQNYELPTLEAEADLDHLLLRVSHLQLDTLAEALAQSQLLSEELQRTFDRHSPVGRLDAIELEIALEQQKVADWRFRTEMTNVGMTAVDAVPGFSGATGYLSISPGDGQIDIDSTDMSLSFPLVYRDQLDFDSLQTQLRWELTEDRLELRSGPIIAVAEEGPVRGLFSLVQPLGDKAGLTDMNLMIGLRDTDPSYRSKYLPYSLNGELLDWLESSIGAGVVNAGAFLWRGALKKDAVEDRTVQLFFDIADTELMYDAGWPRLDNVDGLVVIDDSRVSVTTSRARLYDTPVTSATVVVAPEPGRGLTLRLDAETHGRAADGLQLVNDSTLTKIVGDVFSEWELRGALRTRLQLGLDLSGNKRAPEIEVHTAWQDTQVQAHGLDLTFQDVNGEVTFSSVNGFGGSGLSGLLWGKPIAVHLEHGADAEELGPLHIDLAGAAEMADVKDWLGLELLAVAQGQTGFNARLLIDNEESPVFSVRSDLEGVSLDVPMPLGKMPLEELEFNLHLPLGSEKPRLTVELGKRLAMQLQFAGRKILSGHFIVNPRDNVTTMIREGSFILGGELDELTWHEWEGFVGQYVLEDDAVSNSLALDEPDSIEVVESDVDSELRLDALKIRRLNVMGKSFDDVQLSAWQEATQWRVKAETPWLEGVVGESGEGYQLVIDRLDIAGLMETYGSDISEDFTTDQLLPSMDVSIADLENDGLDLGHLNFRLKDQGDRLEVSGIQGELYGMGVGGTQGLTLTWHSRSPEPSTSLQGDISFTDIGDALESFNYERFLRTEHGNISVDISWPGSPFDTKGSSLWGDIAFETGPGTFLKTSNTTAGTLRVLGILNLAALVQRTELGIDSLFTSGVSFGQGHGEVSFSEGVVMVDDIEVNGRSSGFSFVGELDLMADEIDGQLVATLPIGSNLPWMAAVVGGLPAAAGVFVVSKLFETQVDSFSSLVYDVSGSLDQPEMALSRVFDDSTRAVKKVDTPAAAPTSSSTDP